MAETDETRADAAGAVDRDARQTARRTRAHGRALRHSAQVRWMRRVIPAVALTGVLGVAAVVFDPFAARLPAVSVGPVSVSGTKITMENPRLSGFKKDDRGYVVTADSALQDVRKPALVELQTMRGRLATDDKGGFATLEARSGLFDTTKESLAIGGDVLIQTDKGESARLRSASVEFKTGAVTSSEPVTVTVPSGTLTADSLSVIDNGRVISFVGRVHALFHGQGKDGQGKADLGKDDRGKPAQDSRAVADEGGRIRTSSAEAPEEAR